MNISKIRIRVGDVEVDFEGPQSFVEDGLIQLVMEVTSTKPSSKPNWQSDADSGSNEKVLDIVPGEIDGYAGITMNALCKKLDVKNETDLVVASAVMISIIGDAETFTIKDINTFAKKATSYVGKYFVSNSSKKITTLTKNDRFREPKDGVYTFSPNERKLVIGRLSGESETD